MLWRWLNDRIRKDAIIMNDGERKLLHWEFDILEFFNRNHPTYFIYARRLLMAVNGADSERLKHQLTYSRTVYVRK